MKSYIFSTFYFVIIFLLSKSLKPFSPQTGGPPYSEGAYRHCHTGRHFEGNAEELLCYLLQARGQHERRRLDDLQTRQKPQGRFKHTRRELLSGLGLHWHLDGRGGRKYETDYMQQELTSSPKFNWCLQLQPFHCHSVGLI